MKVSRALVAAAVSTAFAGAAIAQPSYSVIDLGRPGTNNVGHADAISGSGNYVVGRGVVGNNNAFVWSQAAGTNTILAASGTNNWATGVNDSGLIVGMSSSSAALNADGSAYATPAAVVWRNGTVSTLAASGRVFGVNNAGLAVGSNGAFGNVLFQNAVIYDTTNPDTATNATVIGARTVDGIKMNSAQAINNSGLIIGTGTDAAGFKIALAYDSATQSMTRVATGTSYVVNVGGVPTTNYNPVIAADVNNLGVVVGTVTSNQTAQSQPFVWSAAAGLSSVALPAGMVGGFAAGINDSGTIVGYALNGTDGSNYAFVNVAGTAYLLADLLSNATGWSFTGTSTLTITGIGNDGTISGYANYLENGTTSRIHGFALQVAAVPEPSTYALMLGGLLAVTSLARRRSSHR